jgi:hypothetical protein
VAQLSAAEPLFAAADTRFLGSLYVAAAMDGETATHLRVSPWLSSRQYTLRRDPLNRVDPRLTPFVPVFSCFLGTRSRCWLR